MKAGLQGGGGPTGGWRVSGVCIASLDRIIVGRNRKHVLKKFCRMRERVQRPVCDDLWEVVIGGNAK